MNRLRVLVAEDHAAVRLSVIRLLSKRYDVVAAVNDGRALLDAVSTMHPDVLVVDLSLPVITGIEAASILKKMDCASKIVFLTVHNDPDFVRAAQDAGALGYVLKQQMTNDLPEAIEKAFAGEQFTSPSLRDL
ncbi:MAG TPA: response regulator transcription factor [Pyrinomonadaceae bacterium]|nr:response regulator transcription factor [Pyrinomonadaceae bacterium]